jgi:hypothetical protein
MIKKIIYLIAGLYLIICHYLVFSVLPQQVNVPYLTVLAVCMILGFLSFQTWGDRFTKLFYLSGKFCVGFFVGLYTISTYKTDGWLIAVFGLITIVGVFAGIYFMLLADIKIALATEEDATIHEEWFNGEFWQKITSDCEVGEEYSYLDELKSLLYLDEELVLQEGSTPEFVERLGGEPDFFYGIFKEGNEKGKIAYKKISELEHVIVAFRIIELGAIEKE